MLPVGKRSVERKFAEMTLILKREVIRMVKTQPRYSRARNIFLILFLLSTLTFVCLFLGLVFFSFGAQKEPGGNTNIPIIVTLLGAGASCLTSLVTLVGLVSTTVLTWRKESRDAKVAELERKQKEIEIEKERLELAKLKATQEKR